MSMAKEDTSFDKLSMTELVEWVENHLKAVRTSEPPLDLSDRPIVSKYLKTLELRSKELREALAAIPQGGTSEAILLADRARDKALSVFRRKMQMYELSTEPEEMAAYNALNAMWAKNETLALMNFQVETEGIDNLVFDLTTSRFASQVATLKLEQEVEQIRRDNEAFKQIYTGNSGKNEAKLSYDARELYLNVLENYKRYIEFVQGDNTGDEVIKRLKTLLPT